jgi:hypothetical protein
MSLFVPEAENVALAVGELLQLAPDECDERKIEIGIALCRGCIRF